MRLPAVILAALAAAAEPVVTPELRGRAVAALREGLAKGEKYVKVHAAESLLALGYPQGVDAAFRDELAKSGDEPKYRCGVWRVLARSSPTPAEQQKWVETLRTAAHDKGGPDPVHAAESLAKTGTALRPGDDDALLAEAREGTGVRAACLAWAAANTDPKSGEPLLRKFLAGGDAHARLVAAYAFRHRPAVSGETLAELLKPVPPDAQDSVYRTAAAYAHAPDAQKPAYRDALVSALAGGDGPAKYEACLALARVGRADDLPRVAALLDDPDPDVRVGAATAVLQLERHHRPTLGPLDWTVIALYGLGMLGVGVFYALRTADAEDYLLGGRRMGGFLVGLSLFATLFSTLSYLATPGEIVSKGPTYLVSLAAYPFIAAVVGWLLIPFIMRLPVTTAYELLELRFGLAVRLAGSLVFLLLRLLWMATIMYATVDLVLMPLAGIPPAYRAASYVVLLGLTVVYTALGGLRAVVVTDAAQAAILFAGAIAPLVLVTWQLGGVGAWWPTAWSPHWEPFRLVPDLTSRMPALLIVLDSFIWYVATNGSDQMAVQRFLATRDAPAARRAMFTAMASNAAVLLLLGMVGFAVLGYFRANPHLLAYGQTAEAGADQLFPQYVVVGLPPGLGGLVIAGVLAAAMSSLSSGVTASASIVTVDLLDRLLGRRHSAAGEVLRARLVSLAVGVAVLLLAFAVARVPGNLLTVIYKVVNLLTVPLFMLFFMAMFVPRATPAGALASLAASGAVAVGVGLFDWGGLSVFWMMPLSLAAGVVVGPLVSLLPLGPPGRPLPDRLEPPAGAGAL